MQVRKQLMYKLLKVYWPGSMVVLQLHLVDLCLLKLISEGLSQRKKKKKVEFSDDLHRNSLWYAAYGFQEDEDSHTERDL